MKPKLTLLLFSAAMLILSCKKNDSDSDGDTCPPLIMITKVSGVTNLDGNGMKAVNMVFTYGAGNSLVKIKDGQKTTKFTYDKDYRFIFEVEHADSAVSPVQRQIPALCGFLNTIMQEMSLSLNRPTITLIPLDLSLKCSELRAMAS
jgi:hypothetical protein